MKTFTTAVIRDLLDRVYREKISVSQVVEMLNEMVSEMMSEMMEEMNEPQYKDGDFVINMAGDILIFREKVGISIYDHAHLTSYLRLFIRPALASSTQIERYVTEEEKQKLLDALAKKGKRWNEEKKCIEDIPKRKFKKGDKVRIKDGVSSGDISMKNGGPFIFFVELMDKYIGKELIVEYHNSETGIVRCEGNRYAFYEGWLEPVEGLKKGDWAIFWDGVKKYAIISIYDRPYEGVEYLRHKDARGLMWANAIKLESKKQYRKLLKGEI